MHQKVRLFINGQELEFNKEPAILYNFDMDSIQNPTAVKNSYTKTVQVEGTPRNNQIFNDIWDLTRIQPTNGDIDGYFNPSRRTDFSLFVDGDLYETGYVKLDSISRTHNTSVYNITLYGGVGDFLYSLTYSPTGDKLRLSDLNYIVKGGVTGNPETELDFNIGWNVVKTAWMRLAVPGVFGDARWDVVNFAPCYNGYPDAIDADKVLFNTSGFTDDVRMRQNNTTTTVSGFPTAITESNKTFTLLNGYGFGEVNGKMTEWDIRDLRSYLQRPVLRMKKVIEACCDPTQNGGYEVELDSDFFNSGNTYYENCWVTLPLLTDMEYEEETTQPWAVSISHTTTYNGMYNTVYDIREDSARGQGTNALQVTFRPQLSVRDNAYPRDPSTDAKLYTSAYISGSNSRIDYSSYVYQLVGLDAQNNIVCGSDIYNLTSDVNGSYLNLANTLYQPAYANASIQNRLGYFSKVSTGTYQWGEDITLKMNTNNSKVVTVKLYATMMANITQGRSSISGEIYNTYGYRRGKLYTSTSLTESNYESNTRDASWIKPTLTGLATYGSGSKINSGAKITKKVLLNMDGTPCDYLLGYLKAFGLYLKKDPLRKKINIWTRGNYYNAGSIQDWEERIDRTKSMKITPLTFKHKWYSFNYSQQDKGMFETSYYTKYGNDYGVQKVNTGYNFDSETEDLLKGTVYNNAAEGMEKSPYFYNRVVDGNPDYPTPLFSWVKYTLMAGDDTASVDIASPTNFNDVALSSDGDMYDIYPKVQFRDSKKEPLNGSGVFLFFNGFVNTEDAAGNYAHYTISDDLPEMITYNNNPCWLYTKSIFNRAGQQICDTLSALPSFGRYRYTNNNANILNSWDFGKTKELYVPNTYYLEDANIYDRFWSKYVNDLFDVNTRVCEANVLLPKTQGDRLLRQFFWFDNSLWRINKIIDWNVCSDDTTKVEFIKVQDVTDYTTYVDPVEPTSETLSTTCVMSPDPIPANGGEVTFTVTSNQGWGGNGPDYDWIDFSGNYWYGRNDTGVTYFTATADTNPSSVSREFVVVLVADDDTRQMFTFEQEAGDGIQTLWLQPQSGVIPASGGNFYIGVISDYPWTASTDYTGLISFNSHTGPAGSGTLSATMTQNTYSSPNFVNIKIENSAGVSTRIYFRQEGAS